MSLGDIFNLNTNFGFMPNFSNQLGCTNFPIINFAGGIFAGQTNGFFGTVQQNRMFPMLNSSNIQFAQMPQYQLPAQNGSTPTFAQRNYNLPAFNFQMNNMAYMNNLSFNFGRNLYASLCNNNATTTTATTTASTTDNNTTVQQTTEASDTTKTEKTESSQPCKKSGTSSINKSNLFTDSKLSITKVDDGKTMPYLLIGPKDVDPNEKLPVIVYLHGLYQRGNGLDMLDHFEYDPAKIMKNWDLKNFKGYIICPQLGANERWNNKTAENKLRKLCDNFSSTHNVDKNNVSVLGFSMGGQGALYMANAMSDVFKKAVSLSPYNPGNLGSSMKIPTKAFAGSNDDGKCISMTKGTLKNILGAENSTIVQGQYHGSLPGKVLKTDANNDGCSDIIEWMFT